MGSFIHVRTTRYGPLPGEEDEIVNPGMFGRALAEHLRERLEALGRAATGVCAEDWGWWVALDDAPFTFGACVYAIERRGLDADDAWEYVVTEAPVPTRRRGLGRRRGEPAEPWVDDLGVQLRTILDDDPDIEVLGVADEFPG